MQSWPESDELTPLEIAMGQGASFPICAPTFPEEELVQIIREPEVVSVLPPVPSNFPPSTGDAHAGEDVDTDLDPTSTLDLIIANGIRNGTAESSSRSHPVHLQWPPPQFAPNLYKNADDFVVVLSTRNLPVQDGTPLEKLLTPKVQVCFPEVRKLKLVTHFEDQSKVNLRHILESAACPLMAAFPNIIHLEFSNYHPEILEEINLTRVHDKLEVITVLSVEKEHANFSAFMDLPDNINLKVLNLTTPLFLPDNFCISAFGNTLSDVFTKFMGTLETIVLNVPWLETPLTISFPAVMPALRTFSYTWTELNVVTSTRFELPNIDSTKIFPKLEKLVLRRLPLLDGQCEEELFPDIVRHLYIPFFRMKQVFWPSLRHLDIDYLPVNPFESFGENLTTLIWFLRRVSEICPNLKSPAIEPFRIKV